MIKPTRSILAEISDEEEARIQAMIAADPDCPELTDEQIALSEAARRAFPIKFIEGPVKRAWDDPDP
jgi:hypothetical protein